MQKLECLSRFIYVFFFLPDSAVGIFFVEMKEAGATKIHISALSILCTISECETKLKLLKNPHKITV